MVWYGKVGIGRLGIGWVGQASVEAEFILSLFTPWHLFLLFAPIYFLTTDP